MKYICFIFLTFTVGCLSVDSFYVKKNLSIPQSKKDEINTLTDSIYNCFISKDYAFIERIVDTGLVHNIHGVDSLFKKFDFIATEKKYAFDQFLVKAPPNSNINKVTSQDSFYNYYFDPTGYETYICFVPIYHIDGKSIWLISCVFVKKDKWKLASLDLNLFQYNGKSATEYYNIAKGNFEQGKYLEAYFNMHIAYNLVVPAGPNFHYFKEQEIKDFAQKTLATLKEKGLLPFTVMDVTTNPKITDIETIFPYKKLYPVLRCETAIDIRDTAAVKKEGYEISKYINKYVPEISEINDSIVYKFKTKSTNNMGYSSRFSFVAPSK